MRYYELREVIEHTRVPRNILARWLDAGILPPAVPAEGHGSRRRFDLRDLIAICVLRNLRALGVREELLRRAVDALRLLFNKEIPQDGSWGRANVLWIYLQSMSFPPDPAIHDVAIVTFTDLQHIGARIQEAGESGITINLDSIVSELEESTGESIDGHARLRNAIQEELAKRLKD